MSKRNANNDNKNMALALAVFDVIIWLATVWIAFYLYTILPQWTIIPLAVTEIVITFIVAMLVAALTD